MLKPAQLMSYPHICSWKNVFFVITKTTTKYFLSMKVASRMSIWQRHCIWRWCYRCGALAWSLLDTERYSLPAKRKQSRFTLRKVLMWTDEGKSRAKKICNWNLAGLHYLIILVVPQSADQVSQVFVEQPLEVSLHLFQVQRHFSAIKLISLLSLSAPIAQTGVGEVLATPNGGSSYNEHPSTSFTFP